MVSTKNLVFINKSYCMEKKINKYLILKYINGELKDESEKRFVDNWINQDKQNKNYFDELKALWFSSEINNNVINEAKTNVWSRIENQMLVQEENSKVIKHIFNWKKAIAIAASILLVVSIGISILYFNKNQKSEYYRFTADSGSKSKIELVDGTVVYLNSETELLVPKDFGDKKRNVKLTGEAYFKVQKTKNKSLFTVEASNLNIKVLGTEFNVKSYPEEGTIETTLEKGKVEIENRKGEKIKKIVTLEPNQRAIFIKENGKIMLSDLDIGTQQSKIRANKQEEDKTRKERLVLKDRIETRLYTSWKDGKFEFDGERFENLAVRLERWYGINIEIKTDSIKGVEYTGTFINETLEQAMNALRMTLPFTYTMDIENNVMYIE